MEEVSMWSKLFSAAGWYLWISLAFSALCVLVLVLRAAWRARKGRGWLWVNGERIAEVDTTSTIDISAHAGPGDCIEIEFPGRAQTRCATVSHTERW